MLVEIGKHRPVEDACTRALGAPSVIAPNREPNKHAPGGEGLAPGKAQGARVRHGGTEPKTADEAKAGQTERAPCDAACTFGKCTPIAGGRKQVVGSGTRLGSGRRQRRTGREGCRGSGKALARDAPNTPSFLPLYVYFLETSTHLVRCYYKEVQILRERIWQSTAFVVQRGGGGGHTVPSRGCQEQVQAQGPVATQ